MMPLEHQILSFLYHGWTGIIFGFFFSFISLSIQTSCFIIRLLVMVLFMQLSVLLIFIGLYHINGGVTHLYSILFFLIGILLYYSILYPVIRPLFIKIIQFMTRQLHKIKTILYKLKPKRKNVSKL